MGTGSVRGRERRKEEKERRSISLSQVASYMGTGSVRGKREEKERRKRGGPFH